MTRHTTDQARDPMLGIIGFYFGSSKPGDELHHLVLARCTARNALGLLDTTNPEISVFAIAPVETEEPAETFIERTILAAASHSAPVWGAALTVEIHRAHTDDRDEVAENRLRRMHGDQQVHLHPSAVEETALYAACADGRRWHGLHVLTGPRAGHVDGPRLVEGRYTDADRSAPFARLVRHAVGIPW